MHDDRTARHSQAVRATRTLCRAAALPASTARVPHRSPREPASIAPLARRTRSISVRCSSPSSAVARKTGSSKAGSIACSTAERARNCRSPIECLSGVLTRVVIVTIDTRRSGRLSMSWKADSVAQATVSFCQQAVLERRASGAHAAPASARYDFPDSARLLSLREFGRRRQNTSRLSSAAFPPHVCGGKKA